MRKFTYNYSRFNPVKCLLLLLLLVFNAPCLQAQVFQWAKGFQNADFFEYGNSMAADAQGNAFYAGAFENSLQIGSFSLNAPGYNMYVAKLSQAGNVLWVEHFPNDAFFPGSIYDMQADAAGNLYVTGSFEDSITVGGIGMGAPFLGPDFFVAKIDPSGSVLWAKQATGSSNDEAFNMSLDAAGNIYLTGYTYNSNSGFYYDNNLISGIGEGFLLKINTNGQLVWGKLLDGDFFDVAVEPNGEGFLSGSFSDTQLNLGNGVTVQHSGTGFYTRFLSRFQANGQFVWANPLAGVSVNAMRVRTAPGGNVILSGVFKNNVGYNGINLTGQPNRDDLFLYKVNSSGTVLWARTMANLGWDQSFLGFGAKPLVELDPTGNIVVANVHEGTIELDSGFFHFPFQNTTFEIAILKLSPSGSLIWSDKIGGVGKENITGLAVSGLNSIFISGGTESLNPGAFDTQFGSNLTLNSNTSATFISRMLNEANLFSGSVFLDLNSSGTRDSGEPGIANIQLSVAPGQMLVPTQANGVYNAYTDAGNFQIALSQPPNYYSLTPATHSAAFAGMGLVDSANHFALQPQGVSEDLRISLVQLSAARPGFTYRTRIIYQNAGTVAMDGTIRFVSDTLLAFQNALPATTTADTLVWSFTGLQPFDSRIITVEWHVPDSAALGAQLRLVAHADPVSTDLTPADNVAEINPIITGSYDPNDKLVSHDELSLNQVADRQPLIYTVRFQNTGTDTAFTVMIRDQLSQRLDAGTIEVISASHPFTMQMSGPTTIDWKFSNILLPDSNVNEPASHGYIQYRIKPLANLTAGQHINTSAGIYFDFNAPVLTNITDTEITQPNAVFASVNRVKIHVWPNPASGRFMVRLGTETNGTAELRLFNSIGQQVFKQQLNITDGLVQQEINAGTLPAGIYLVQLQQNGQMYSTQLVWQ